MDGLPEHAAAPQSASGEQPATRLEIASQVLLAHETLGFVVELFETGLIGLRSSAGRVALLEADDEQPLALPSGLGRLSRRGYPARHVVIFGGGEALRRRLSSDDLGGLWVCWQDAGGRWQNREPRRRERRLCEALQDAAARAVARRSWSTEEARAHQRRLLRERDRARAEARELDRFRLLLGQRRPRATFALVGVIALVFALEALWGGVDLPPLLSAMGSLVPERARAGEWWRFFACSFLHGGALHVGLNLLVLSMLGRSLERAIGATRFLLVYFCAALAGSIASSLFVQGQSVGASGAIWGLLGAEAAMAFYPQPLLPPVLIGVARRTALVNLGINMLASFVPRIDMAAHVGGGIAGALVLLLLARSRQLPIQWPAARPPHLGLRVVGAAAAALFLLGLATAWRAGQPWRLASAPPLELRRLPGLPWSIALPAGYALAPASRASAVEVGDLRHDSSVIQIEWAPLDHATPRAELDAELDELTRELRDAEGLELLAEPRLVAELGSDAYIGVRYRYAQNPEIFDDWAIGVHDGERVRVHVSAWTALPHAADGLARRVLQSLGAAELALDERTLLPGALAAR